MIYEDHSSPRREVNLEDYKNPYGGYNKSAYDADKIRSEIENMSSSGEYRDSKTGQLLFTVDSIFEEGPNYYDDGQGEFTKIYKAHFPLKDGQTAEEAFHEWQRKEEAEKLEEERIIRRKETLKNLPPEAKEELNEEIRRIIQNSQREEEANIRRAEDEAIAKEQKKLAEKKAKKAKIEARKKKILEKIRKRNADPVWQAISSATKALVASNQKTEAKILIQSYLKEHTK